MQIVKYIKFGMRSYAITEISEQIYFIKLRNNY